MLPILEFFEIWIVNNFNVLTAFINFVMFLFQCVCFILVQKLVIPQNYANGGWWGGGWQQSAPVLFVFCFCFHFYIFRWNPNKMEPDNHCFWSIYRKKELLEPSGKVWYIAQERRVTSKFSGAIYVFVIKLAFPFPFDQTIKTVLPTRLVWSKCLLC